MNFDRFKDIKLNLKSPQEYDKKYVSSLTSLGKRPDKKIQLVHKLHPTCHTGMPAYLYDKWGVFQIPNTGYILLQQFRYFINNTLRSVTILYAALGPQEGFTICQIFVCIQLQNALLQLRIVF